MNLWDMNPDDANLQAEADQLIAGGCDTVEKLVEETGMSAATAERHLSRQ